MEKKSILIELQLSQAMKIHNVFHPNFLQKASPNPLIGQVNEVVTSIIIQNDISGRLKIFLILGIIEAKSNIGFNGLAGMKTGNSIIFLDLIIF